MATSIRDIADRAGVATSTVSRVINASPRYRISDKTAKRIWQAVRELDYKVDNVARQIIRRRWHGDKTRGGLYRIGVVHPGFDNELAASFYYDILFGIQAEILDRRFVLAGLFESRQLRDEASRFHATDPAEVDGLLVLGSIPAQMRQDLQARVRANVSLVVEPAPDHDSLDFDHHDAMVTMVKHLAGVGHRLIAYIGQHQTNKTYYPSHQRTMGYLDAMRELGLPVRPGYTIDVSGARQNEFKVQLEQFLALKPRPTAIACSSDRVCIEMLRRLTQAGVRVPEDVALTGFEDLDVASLIIPRLTTMRAHRRQLGRDAVAMLVRRLENPQAPVEHRVLPTQLMVRESCGSNLAHRPAPTS